jgi:hypothetical protein
VAVGSIADCWRTVKQNTASGKTYPIAQLPTETHYPIAATAINTQGIACNFRNACVPSIAILNNSGIDLVAFGVRFDDCIR